MARYRKLPVEVEAITFEELVAYERETMMTHDIMLPWVFFYKGHVIKHDLDNRYFIATLEGHMEMSPSDMLITGVKGEIYPCKRDIFEQTYEAVAAPEGDK